MAECGGRRFGQPAMIAQLARCRRMSWLAALSVRDQAHVRMSDLTPSRTRSRWMNERLDNAYQNRLSRIRVFVRSKVWVPATGFRYSPVERMGLTLRRHRLIVCIQLQFHSCKPIHFSGCGSGWATFRGWDEAPVSALWLPWKYRVSQEKPLHTALNHQP